MWELHSGKSDEKIITEYAKKDFYKKLPGSWILVLPNEQRVFEDPTFASVTQQALLYIYQRDNPEYDDYFCWQQPQEVV